MVIIFKTTEAGATTTPRPRRNGTNATRPVGYTGGAVALLRVGTGGAPASAGAGASGQEPVQAEPAVQLKGDDATAAKMAAVWWAPFLIGSCRQRL